DFRFRQRISLSVDRLATVDFRAADMDVRVAADADVFGGDLLARLAHGAVDCAAKRGAGSGAVRLGRRRGGVAIAGRQQRDNGEAGDEGKAVGMGHGRVPGQSDASSFWIMFSQSSTSSGSGVA